MEDDSERIAKLKALCDQLDGLKKQADEICKAANLEIRRSRGSALTERRKVSRNPTKKTPRRKRRAR
jgi:hypothetical protein